MPNDKFRSQLLLHGIVFIWGFTAIIGKLISLEALALVWFRMLFAVFFIWGYIAYKGIEWRYSRKQIAVFLLAGTVIALHWFTFFKAIKVSNVSVTLACLSTGAFFTSLIEPMVSRKKIVGYEIVFGLLVVGGLALIFNVETQYVEGIVLALVSAFLSATFAIINAKLVIKHEPVVLSLFELIGGVLFFTLLLAYSGSFSTAFFQLSASDLVYLLLLSSVCTAFAMIASTALLRVLDAYTVMLTINLEPVYGILLAMLLFDQSETMSGTFYLGALVILLTVIANGILKSRKSAD
ncbi:DMT family transporter [Flavobacterium sp.]|jgi:drug/metabolite transporter (DMT)-like permease|uniref:DMT family transporter n=1 Tax=Flavobacterium sp. TaxID=239 RepID=UPI00260E8838|nr:DMT family transporter [Flavobacterium sp.]